MADQHYLPPAPIGSPDGSFAWVEWYRKLREVAESGQTAYIQLTTVTDPALADKLNKNAADVLGGTITFNTLGAFKIGDVTWNGATITGTGLLFNQYGIVGAYSGSPKFVLKSDGTATFGGELSAATGTFSGSLSAATGTFAGSLSAATGTFSGSLSAATGTFTGTVSGGSFSGGTIDIGGSDTSSFHVDSSGNIWSGAATYASAPFKVSSLGEITATSGTFSGNISTPGYMYSNAAVYNSTYNAAFWAEPTGSGMHGVVGITHNSSVAGIYGSASNANAYGVYANHTGGGSALYVNGKMSITDPTLVTNLNAQLWNGLTVGSPTTGSATVTFNSTNKPGSNSTNTWLPITSGGVTVYIPVWT